MSHTITSREEYDQKALAADAKVVVDFYADWCAPCKALTPTLTDVVDKAEGDVQLLKVDVDKHPELAAEYGVRGIPALFFLKGGKVVSQLTGNQPARVLESELQKIL